VQQVRQAEQQAVELGLQGREVRLDAGERAAEILHLREQRRDVLSLRLGATDGLRARVALVAQAVQLELQRLAPVLQRAELRRVEHEAATREVRSHRARIRPQEPAVEHRSSCLACGRRRTGSSGAAGTRTACCGAPRQPWPPPLRWRNRARASPILISRPRGAG
jgi:hypothetical protein